MDNELFELVIEETPKTEKQTDNDLLIDLKASIKSANIQAELIDHCKLNYKSDVQHIEQLAQILNKRGRKVQITKNEEYLSISY